VGGNWSRPATDDELRDEEQWWSLISDDAPIAPLDLADLYRSGYHTGISHLHHMYTARNFAAISLLMSEISQAPQHMRDALALLVLSFNQSHATLMTRVVVKKGQSDFVVTGAQPGVLYVSALPLEKNVFLGVSRKAKVLASAFAQTEGSESHVAVTNASSLAMTETEGSVDYVFTDPPFGGFIPYGEIGQVNELWFGTRTVIEDEIGISSARGKGMESYQTGLAGVFTEVARVMKDSAIATVVFHSSQPGVWNALASALSLAGLAVRDASILDRKQPTFKQAQGGSAVRGDALLLVDKVDSSSGFGSAGAAKGKAKNAQHAYTEYVTTQLQRGLAIDLSSGEFYESWAVK
jgi:hypothetical protein